ncbi:MAG: hypothetical protein R3E31_30245 [Chloroflexota bacterium]
MGKAVGVHLAVLRQAEDRFPVGLQVAWRAHLGDETQLAVTRIPKSVGRTRRDDDVLANIQQVLYAIHYYAQFT